MRITPDSAGQVEPVARDPIELGASSGDWQVAAGYLDLFVVRLQGEGGSSRRRFLLRLEAGQLLRALPLPDGYELLAVAGLGCRLEAVTGSEPALVDQWQAELAQSLETEADRIEADPDALEAVFEQLFERRQQHVRQEAQRRQELAVERQQAGVQALASAFMEADGAAPPQSEQDPVWQALQRVVTAIGCELQRAPNTAQLSATERLRAILNASDLRYRTVLLRGRWWLEDQGPLFVWTGETAEPAALLPTAGGYHLWLPATGTSVPVDAELAASLDDAATMVYPSLPEAPQRLPDLFRFAVRGGGPDVTRIAIVGLVGAVLGVITPVASGILVDQILPAGDRGLLLMIALLLFGSGAGAVAFGLVRAFARLRLEARADVRIQTALFDRVLRLPLGLVKRYAVGDLVDRLLGMQRVREQLSGAALSAVLSMLFSVTSLIVLFFYSAMLAMLALLLVLFYGLVVISLIMRQLRHERLQAEARGRVQGFNTQMLIGMSKLRVAHAEGRAFGNWAQLFARQKTHFLDAGRVANQLGVFQAAFSPLSSAVVIIGIVLLADHLRLFGQMGAPVIMPGSDDAGAMTAGMFVAFSAAFTQFLGSAQQGVEAISGGLSAIPQLERARPILANPVESRRDKRDPGEIAGAITFNDVSFRYAEDGPLILDRLSFHIEPGEFVAVVGPSGSGKSTAQRLLMGLEEPFAGEVRIDGQALPGLDLARVRRQLGIVLQQNTLPGGPLHQVILGETDGTLDDAWEAARLAGLEADIRAMPMGMHTVLQDGATTLSGGQRQRLAIARALVRKPRMLLLDEATSALDNASQALVSRTLSELDVTRVLVAHRLSTIRQADRILVLEGGRLVEEGSFETLMAAEGAFARLARRQMV